jgi:hypothetical protein
MRKVRVTDNKESRPACKNQSMKQGKQLELKVSGKKKNVKK